MSLREFVARACYVAVILAIAYTVVAVVYRFRHPELTETQLFLAVPDAWMWRD